MTDPPDPHLLAADHLPTPFTAEEIRRGCPAGRTIVLRVQEHDAEPYTRRIRFVATDSEGAEQESQDVDDHGRPLAPQARRHSTWLDLQIHASFPADRTVVDADVIETPLGRVECVRYTRIEGQLTDTFWFDTSRPGMPVRLTSEVAGRIVELVTMIEDSVAGVDTSDRAE